MRASHLPLLNIVSAPAVHPSGEYAVVAVTHPDFASDSYVGQLWRVPLRGGEPVRITRGHRDTAARFSPDGRLLGFLRGEPGRPAQLAIVPASGGEPMLVTDAKLGVTEFAFSPDGSRLAFVSRVPEDGRYGTLDDVSAQQEDPRRITRLQFQHNGVGYTADQRSHVFVLEVPDPHGEPPVKPIGRAAADGAEFRAVPEARQLSGGDHDHHALAWDGDSVLAVAARHPEWDLDLREDVYRFALDGGEPVRITDSHAGPGAIGHLVVVAGEVFFLAGELGEDGLGFFGRNPGVYAVPLAGGESRRLTEPERHIEAIFPDAHGALAVETVRGSGIALAVTSDGVGESWRLPGSVRSLGSGGGARLAVLAGPTTSGELVRLDRPLPALTDFAAPLRAVAAPIAPTELVATASDGYPVHGWAFLPAGEGPHPVLLLIHGGPFAAYSDAFFDEPQVYAEAGYAVVMCNPRGSAGYGEAHARAIEGAFGDRDMVDVLAFLDHALATVPGLDADRVGVMGGSYGGFLTAWLIAHEHRFAGAIVERGYVDAKSFVGASDIGWFFPRACHGDQAAMDAQSPLLLAGQVRTPTLVIHSENDLRCPIGIALRYYTELKQGGVDAELLVFPGENHELSRSGTPHHRRARFEHILDWWSRQLPVTKPT